MESFDFNPDARSQVISMPPATECDDFDHFMISPAAWRGDMDGIHFDGNGEYAYWHWAPWYGGEDIWHSLRDWIASEVEDAEMMIRKGKLRSA